MNVSKLLWQSTSVTRNYWSTGWPLSPFTVRHCWRKNKFDSRSGKMKLLVTRSKWINRTAALSGRCDTFIYLFFFFFIIFISVRCSFDDHERQERNNVTSEVEFAVNSITRYRERASRIGKNWLFLINNHPVGPTGGYKIAWCLPTTATPHRN